MILGWVSSSQLAIKPHFPASSLIIVEAKDLQRLLKEDC